MQKITQEAIDEAKEQAENNDRIGSGASVFFSRFNVPQAKENRRIIDGNQGREGDSREKTRDDDLEEGEIRSDDDEDTQSMERNAIQVSEFGTNLLNFTTRDDDLEEGEIQTDDDDESDNIEMNDRRTVESTASRQEHINLDSSVTSQVHSTPQNHVDGESSSWTENSITRLRAERADVYDFETGFDSPLSQRDSQGGTEMYDLQHDHDYYSRQQVQNEAMELDDRAYFDDYDDHLMPRVPLEIDQDEIDIELIFNSVGLFNEEVNNPIAVDNNGGRKTLVDSNYGEISAGNIQPQPERLPQVIEEDQRHYISQTDHKNRLYEPNQDDGSDEWYICNHMADVKIILSNYNIHHTSSNKRYIHYQKETIDAFSSYYRLATNMHAPVIIYFNNTYKPKEENVDGFIVARCTLRFPNNGKTTCKGSILCNPNTGEITLKETCVHDDQRDDIALQLIVRRHAINVKQGFPSERCCEGSADIASLYGVLDKLWSNEQIRRKVFGKLRMESTNVFPPNLDCSTINGCRVLLDTSGNYEMTGDATVIWIADGAEQYIRSCEFVNCDGKFSEIPNGYQQLYCISTKDTRSDAQIPLIFALTNRKSEVSYEQIFRVARDHGLNPFYLSSDFEMAAINAAYAIWLLIQVWGCWRHYKVALLKKLKKTIPKDDWSPTYGRFLKCIYGLSFAPVNRVNDWFQIIENAFSGIHPKMPDYFRYLKDTWFKVDASFPIGLWHCRERVAIGRDYTNNGSEHLFAKYKRLYDHTNYTVLKLAVSKSVDWSLRVFRDIDSKRTWLNRRRSDRPAMYRDRNFIRIVNTRYANFQSFNAAVHAYMHDPKLFH
ncbi:unnamed protein product [Caenorhabditis nigoni]